MTPPSDRTGRRADAPPAPVDPATGGPQTREQDLGERGNELEHPNRQFQADSEVDAEALAPAESASRDPGAGAHDIGQPTGLYRPGEPIADTKAPPGPIGDRWN